jgi:hypothetical protein
MSRILLIVTAWSVALALLGGCAAGTSPQLKGKGSTDVKIGGDKP